MTPRGPVKLVLRNIAVVTALFTLAGPSWGGEATTVTVTFDAATSHLVSARFNTRPLAESLFSKLIAPDNTDDDELGGDADIAQVAEDGPLLSWSLVLEFDNPDTNILSPFSNVGDHTTLDNTITLNSDFAGITTFQQSAGNANATSNLALVVDAAALDPLIRELFGPDETLLETTASSFVGPFGHSDPGGAGGGSQILPEPDSVATAGGKKIVGGAATSRTTHSTLVNILDVSADAGGGGEGTNPVTTILSPHGNLTTTDAVANDISLNTIFAGVTTFQQQAGGANGQSNLVALVFDSGSSAPLSQDQ